MRLQRLASVCGIAIALAAATYAQPYDHKGTVEGWNVFYNQATGGCFVEHQTPDAIVMQMGTQADMLGVEGQNYGFLAVYVPIAADVAAGEERPVRFEIAGTTYGGEAIGVSRDGYSGGYAVANSQNFIDDVANQPTMVVNPGTDREMSVDLSGTRAAIEALRACQTEMAG